MKTELEKKLIELLSTAPVLLPDRLSVLARADLEMLLYFEILNAALKGADEGGVP